MIENQYVERLFREQTDFHFEKYNHAKQKSDAKSATATKYMPIKALRHPGQSTDSFDTNGNKKKKKKPTNIVQEQMIRIDKINR